MLLGVQLGNTTLRHAHLNGKAVERAGNLTLPPCEDPLPTDWVPVGPFEAVLVGSVNPRRLEELLSTLQASGAPVLVAGGNLPVPIPNRYRDPSEVGVDRLLNALSVSRLWPGRGTVVLDFGTAMSVSVVSPAGEFLGGPIGAGTAALAAGLSGRTAQLPEVHMDRPPSLLAATSTREAITAGIYWQLVGGASRILDGLEAELPFPFGVVATGGDAALLVPAIPRVDVVDEDLTLRGLALCYILRSRGPQ